MSNMRMPGFSAEAAIQRRMTARLPVIVGGGGGPVDPRCDGVGCVCTSVDDCIDLWVNTDLCSTSIICYGEIPNNFYCYCVQK
jgi:hypothetical protein